MKPFLMKVQHRVAFALMTAATISLSAASGAIADVLDDAIAASEARPVVPLISRETFLARHQLRDVHLSPDGKHLAYIVIQGKVRQLWVMVVETGENQHLFTSKLMDDLEWSGDSQYIFMGSEQGVAVASLDPSSSPAFVINLDQEEDQYSYGVDEMLPHAFYVSLRAEDKKSHSVFRVFPDGSKEEIFKDAIQTNDFLLNPQGELTFFRRVKDHHFEIVKRSGDQQTLLFTCEADDPCSLRGFDAKSNSLIMQARLEGDLSSLYSVSLEGDQVIRLHSDPKRRYDIRHVTIDPSTDEPILAAYEDDYYSVYGLRQDVKEILAAIKVKISSSHLVYRPDATLKRWLVVDAAPSEARSYYYLYDAETGEVTRPLKHVVDALIEKQPIIQSEQAAIRVPVHYQVSDGMMQQGYVTLPVGRDLSTVPLVVSPHGGPWSRVRGDYSSRTQLLANRGYAVFEPNFRASTGFGRAYVKSANKDFGDGRVQQDILDGMEYILSRGIGDRNKLAMFGHSFGGFSTLGALAFTPDLFKVGIAGAPPVDLVKAIRTFKITQTNQAGLLRYEMFKNLAVDVDDPVDVARLSANSPDRHAGQVKKPLYIWAGGKDPKVSILNVRDYALRQSEAGKPVMLMVEPRAGHSPRDDIHVEAYFYMMEKALAEHLGGRIETALSQKLVRYLRRSVVIDSNDFTPPPR